MTSDFQKYWQSLSETSRKHLLFMHREDALEVVFNESAKAARADEREKCASRVKRSLHTHGYIDPDGGYKMLYLSDTINAIMEE